MSSSGNNDDEDIDFADLIGEVKTLSNDRVVPTRPKPSAKPKETLRDQGEVMQTLAHGELTIDEMQPGELLEFVRPGIQNQVLRKLKRGQFSIGAELDLHGHTKLEALDALEEFLNFAREENIRCVRVIHGKGYGSTNKGPVIKPLVNKALRRKDEVLAFCSARPVDGGSGALYVLLKSK